MQHAYNSKNLFRALLGLGLSLGTVAASAQAVTPISVASGVIYTQDFDGIGPTGTAYPAGWSGLRFAGTGAIGQDLNLTATDGSAGSGGVYNVGAANDNDRAMGSISSNSTTPAFGAAFTNTTGADVTQVNVAYQGEQWKSGALDNQNEVLSFEYSLDATSLNTGTWTPVATLNVTELANANTSNTAINGNDAANRASLAGSLTGITWPAGTTMWIRWKDNNDTGNDALLAVDNFALSTGTTPLSTRKALTAGNVRVFPNPSANNLTIQVAGRTAKTAVTVTDLMGRTVLRGASALDGSFSLSALPAGQYMLLVQDGNTLTSHKIVKQ
ncbi:T9SS type A sorting domain-containing protein [Hymenobacter sp. NST-14]|uniref:T9SS type A sorting domain-containing protein n=1 Tax=Hymenobacter piscis TaxID=2839984 RepID=UPI001C02A582|nr:T9SS type A sorting domain-containing protein [Hymenobacter piscis]MBT9395273.1 T9SS type A sorting domain-containing protein [Hymenobacter piscis]